MAREVAPGRTVRMAGKLFPEYAYDPFSGEPIWSRQLREEQEWIAARKEADAEGPCEGLREVEVYTDPPLRCRCHRIIYWKAESCRVYYCVGCDTIPRECKCKELTRVPGA